MSFVSYAQNLEDVMLWRALKHVECGFYIDVGAKDSSMDSVTKAFYEREWHGINIEPLSCHYADLLRERPRDINLCCAAGSENGELKLWECDVLGWATASSSVAMQHSSEGHVGKLHKVPVFTLAKICQQHATKQINFLKIDVEGFEKCVLEGMDFKLFRPWIVVVEGTKPNSQQDAHEEWEWILESANYFFVYADGVNRFYVAKEYENLAGSFRYPPNVFDDFIRGEQLDLEKRAHHAEEKVHQAKEKAHQTEAGLHAVYNSRSWKITRPFRWASKAIRWFVRGSLAWLTFAPMSRPRRFVRQLCIQLKKFIYSRTRLKALVLHLLAPFPGLKVRLEMVGNQPMSVPCPSFIEEPEPRSPHARKIYSDLKTAIENKRCD